MGDYLRRGSQLSLSKGREFIKCTAGLQLVRNGRSSIVTRIIAFIAISVIIPSNVDHVYNRVAKWPTGTNTLMLCKGIIHVSGNNGAWLEDDSLKPVA